MAQADVALGGVGDDLRRVLEQGQRPGLLVAVEAGRDDDRPRSGAGQADQRELAAPLDDRAVA